jgi:hypothetical protein
MVATIPWLQSGAGTVDLTPSILNLFSGPIPTSFSMSGLIDDWPDQGSSIGSGWVVVSGSMQDVSYARPKTVIPDIFSWQGTVPVLPFGSIVFPLKVTGEYHWGETAGFNFQYELVVAQLGYAVPQLTVGYTAGRSLAQVVTFTLESDQQDIVTLPGDDEALTIALNANKVSDLSWDGEIPIGDVRRRGYIHTTRGLQTVEHLILVARAHLIARSRAVEISFEMDFRDALALRSLRKAALLHDHRLPGGEATGKIINVALGLNGDDGTAIGKITIASCVGKGGSHTADDGVNSYIDDYIDDFYQMTNQIVLTDTVDIAWTIPDPVMFDDGLDFIAGLNPQAVIQQLSLTNPASAQEVVIRAAGDGANTDQAKISEVVKNNPTQITLQLKPMEGGPFQGEVVISLSDLVIPKQIDLEAPSNA